jgi:hypothetical protein
MTGCRTLTLVAACVCTSWGVAPPVGALRRRAGRGGWLALAAVLWLWLAGQIVWQCSMGGWRARRRPPAPRAGWWRTSAPTSVCCSWRGVAWDGCERGRGSTVRSSGSQARLWAGTCLRRRFAVRHATTSSVAIALAYPVGDLVILASVLVMLIAQLLIAFAALQSEPPHPAPERTRAPGDRRNDRSWRA